MTPRLEIEFVRLSVDLLRQSYGLYVHTREACEYVDFRTEPLADPVGGRRAEPADTRLERPEILRGSTPGVSCSSDPPTMALLYR